MSQRVYNFGAGPAALPLPVLERMRDELLDFEGTGMSILESSHRGPAYSRVHQRAGANVRKLLNLPDDYAILFMTGGARSQFSLLPMNVLGSGRAAYLVTGRWSELAVEAAGAVGNVGELWSSAAGGHREVPGRGEVRAAGDEVYLHYTSNNTIYGTQFDAVPEADGVPLAADMSSDFLSRPVDVSKFGVIYASAQKNLGPAGVTLVIVRRDLLERSPEELPATFSYSRMAAKDSLLNTPPAFSIYGLALVTDHLLATGGLEAAAERNRKKAAVLYAAIDGSGGFYRGHAAPASRSAMNVTFRLPSPELEADFVAAAQAEGLAGLKGYRLVGGIRASIYNAAELAGVEALVAFMSEFQRTRG